MQMLVHKGRVSYEPNSLDPKMPRENPRRGFATFPAPEQGPKSRLRPESFADHYSQALLFLTSMTEPERRHMAAAFAFELGKCKALPVRKRMLGRLSLVDSGFSDEVAALLGMEGEAEKLEPAAPTKKPAQASAALSQVAKAPQTIAGRKIGLLVTDGVAEETVAALKKQAAAEGATVAVIAPKAGGAKAKSGAKVAADDFLAGAPSCLFDAVVVAPSAAGAKELAQTAAAVDWVRDAFAHLKVIGYFAEAAPILEAAHIRGNGDAGLIAVAGDDFGPFIAAAKFHRIWDREAKVKPAKAP